MSSRRAAAAWCAYLSSRAIRRRPLSRRSEAFEGLTAAASDRAVLPFPSHEIDPYRGLSPHVGVTSARARVLHAIASGTARIVVASAAALLPRVTGADRLLRASMDLEPGQDI